MGIVKFESKSFFLQTWATRLKKQPETRDQYFVTRNNYKHTKAEEEIAEIHRP